VRENIKKVAAIVNTDTGRAPGIRQMQQALTLEVIWCYSFVQKKTEYKFFIRIKTTVSGFLLPLTFSHQTQHVMQNIDHLKENW